MTWTARGITTMLALTPTPTTIRRQTGAPGMGVGWLVESVVSHIAVCAAAPFLAAVTYLVAERLETVLAERLLAAKGDEHADDVSP